jgi:hypothetical protein
MRLSKDCLLLTLVVLTVSMIFTKTVAAQTTSEPLPNPVLVYVGPEFYQANGKDWTRYKYTVANNDSYPDELFSVAPDLPPCGRNTRASRTWVDFYDSTGRRLNGFCALSNSQALDGIWFAAETNTIPPSWVYIELNDRRTNTKYKSQLAETSQ